MTKNPVSMRIDQDLWERAQTCAEYKKTTVTQLVTDSLLEQVETIERQIELSAHVPQYARNLTKRARCPDSLKKRIREKYNNTCQSCGITEQKWYDTVGHQQSRNEQRLHVAHIIAQCNFENPKDAHTEDNLTLLCPKCHWAEHRIRASYVDYNNRIPNQNVD